MNRGFAPVINILILALMIGVGGYLAIKNSIKSAPSSNGVLESESEKAEDNNTSNSNEQPNIQTSSVSARIEDAKNPTGAGLLKDAVCLTSATMNDEEEGLYKASKSYLLSKGYTEAHFNTHFCPLAVRYEYHEALGTIPRYGYARIVYKATIEPYVAWWQHHFPVEIDSSNKPVIKNGTAKIDTSGKVTIPNIETGSTAPAISPSLAASRMEKLIGAWSGPMSVHMGPGVGKNALKIYARATNANPTSMSCADSIRVGLIDLQVGIGEISYTGACE